MHAHAFTSRIYHTYTMTVSHTHQCVCMGAACTSRCEEHAYPHMCMHIQVWSPVRCREAHTPCISIAYPHTCALDSTHPLRLLACILYMHLLYMHLLYMHLLYMHLLYSYMHLLYMQNLVYASCMCIVYVLQAWAAQRRGML